MVNDCGVVFDVSGIIGSLRYGHSIELLLAQVYCLLVGFLCICIEQVYRKNRTRSHEILELYYWTSQCLIFSVLSSDHTLLLVRAFLLRFFNAWEVDYERNLGGGR